MADCDIQKTDKMNLQEFFEQELGDLDIFQVITIEDHSEYLLVIPNRRDQGGMNIEEIRTYNLPDMAGKYFDHKDWKLLIDKLIEKSITFVPQIGLVHYIK